MGSESLYEDGRRLHDEGELDLAVEHYRRSIAEDPSQAEVFVSLAEAYYDRNDVVEASLACERALEIEPGDIRASALLARAYLELGRAQEALPFALRGTETPAPEPFALWTLGAVFLELGRYEDAERLYLMTIGSVRYPEENAADAEWRRHLEREDLGYLCFGVGLACRGQGKTQEAVAWYDRALHYLPGHPEVSYEKGILLERSGRWREALGCYKQAIRSDPFFAEARIRSGVALYQLGEILTARDILLSIREESSGGPEAAYVLGRIAEQRGFAFEAVDYYREARTIDASMAPAWLREGLLLRGLGYGAEGTRCLEQARESGSTAARWILESESAPGAVKDGPDP